MRLFPILLLTIVLVAALSFYPSDSTPTVSASTIYYPGYISPTYGGVDGHLYSYDPDYATARTATLADVVDYAGTSFMIGQGEDGTNDNIWRCGVFFDTSGLSSNITITAAELQFYVRDQDLDTHFAVTVVRGANLHTPLATDDYYSLFSETVSRGSLMTNDGSWTTSDYNTIVLNADGMEDIIPTGITKYGLRSSLDIAGTPPGGSTDQWVDIYGTEKGYGYAPRLKVTYTSQAVGNPDDLAIQKAKVFTSFHESGDWLFIFEYSVLYNWGVPNEDPREYFFLQLLDGSDNVLHQVRCPAWGYRPGSIYINAAAAALLEWEGTYSIRIKGDPIKFPSSQPEFEYDLVTDDWVGGIIGIKYWVIESAKSMASYDTGNPLAYVVFVPTKFTFVLNEDGGGVFLGGIPELDRVLPGLFSSYITNFSDPDEDTEWTYQGEDNMANNFGTQVMSAFTDAGDIFGLSGQQFGGLVLFVLFLAGAGAAMLATGAPAGSIAVALPILAAGGYLGVIPLVAIAVIGSICSLLLVWHFWLRST